MTDIVLAINRNMPTKSRIELLTGKDVEVYHIHDNDRSKSHTNHIYTLENIRKIDSELATEIELVAYFYGYHYQNNSNERFQRYYKKYPNIGDHKPFFCV